MTHYRKRSLVVEAIQWTGDNIVDIWNHFGAGSIYIVATDRLEITTLEGPVNASLNDWIIRGVKGELYPCKPDIFAAIYDLAEEPC